MHMPRLIPSIVALTLALCSFAFGVKNSSVSVRVASTTSGEIDSILLVKNGFHIVHEQQVATKIVQERWDWDGPGNNKRYREITDRWTEYDGDGRIIHISDTNSTSQGYYNKISDEHREYAGGKLVKLTRREWSCDSIRKNKNDSQLISAETVLYTPQYTWKHSESEDVGTWIIRTDSTVFTPDHQPAVTYTYTSMGDSMVEEFTYDQYSRLKYRRLSMKQFWSPPWEMEATFYTYREDGSHMERDSVWRIDPDMNVAAKRAGDPKAKDFCWKRLLCAPSTGTFNRLEWWEERTYDANQNMILDQKWTQYAYDWEDYSWTYNDKNQLIRHTEWRGDPPNVKPNDVVYGESCRDSIWYTYEDSVLVTEKSWHYCNTYYDSSYTDYRFNGKPLDPNRTEITDYVGFEGFSKVKTTYKDGRIDVRRYYGKDELIRKKEDQPMFDEDSNTTTYTYFK